MTKEKTSSIQLISSKEDLSKSLVELNKRSFENAQTFLFQLNDFEKALPLYKKVINLNIDDTITERSLLDLASEYIHQGNRTTSDSIIAIVEAKFPKGVYTTKKSAVENKKSQEKQLEIVNLMFEKDYSKRLTAIEFLRMPFFSEEIARENYQQTKC
jgi:tetratricopeptide (TPR) repeat protein